MTHLDVADRLSFVREATGQNDGAWVEAILRVVGCQKGDPWCAAFVSFCLCIANQGKNPLPMTASCAAIHAYAKKHGLILKTPEPGCLFLVLNSDGHAHHTGFCTGPAINGKVSTIEGNTNTDGSRDGWGVFARHRTLSSSLAFVKVP